MATNTLLHALFNHDFSLDANASDVKNAFFAKALGLGDLQKVHDAISASSATIGGRTMPAAMLIPGRHRDAPFMVLAQLHGNEPAGLAGIALVMALAEARMLERDVLAVIGNPLAAKQYFAVWEKAPHARQETRDCYRCGLSDTGALLPDMNRIPDGFMDRPAADHHTRRAQELFTLGQHISGILDIHSARGNMLCITDHKHDSELKDSPIRSVLMELAEAISAHASAAVTVKTFKTILHPLPNIKAQVGIEAGRHEAPDTPHNAAAFTLSLLHTLGITSATPLYTQENGIFEAYHVRPRITYADLQYGKTLRAHDQVFMAKACHALASVPERCDHVIVKQADDIYAIQSVTDFTRKPAGSMEYAIYQYDEMEAIHKDQVVAVAVPSGTAFKAPSDFSGIFVSKSAVLYDKDPSVGPWPVAADQIGKVKFCYPCDVGEMKIHF